MNTSTLPFLPYTDSSPTSSAAPYRRQQQHSNKKCRKSDAHTQTRHALYSSNICARARIASITSNLWPPGMASLVDTPNAEVESGGAVQAEQSISHSTASDARLLGR